MPDNSKLIGLLTAEVVESLDLGEYRDDWKGQALQILVNAPCVIEDLAGKTMDEIPRQDKVSTVCMFTSLPAIEVSKFEDGLLYWILGESLTRYNKFMEHKSTFTKAD